MVVLAFGTPSLLRKSYDALLRLAGSRHAPMWLALHAFCEGVFFPIPPDVMLMPMVLADRSKAWRYALVTVLASVMGGSVGYAIGFFLEPVGKAILALTGASNGIETFQAFFKQWGILILALPIPYKITAIASGVAHFDFTTFFLASVGIRGLRFFALAALLRAYGPPVQAVVEKRLALVTSGVAVAIVAVIAALHFLT